MSTAWDQFNFRLPKTLLDRLRVCAESEGKSAGEFIRDAVASELDRVALMRLALLLEERMKEPAA